MFYIASFFNFYSCKRNVPLIWIKFLSENNMKIHSTIKGIQVLKITLYSKLNLYLSIPLIFRLVPPIGSY